MEYNRSQRLAVSFYEGAMLVLAGPGSGKTAVITGRALSLIEDRGVPPEKILVITFSKAAALEMKQRFIKAGRGNVRYDSITFSTFHALFFRIIRDAYDYDISNIISDNEKNIYLTDAMHSADVGVQNEREFKEKLSGCISMLKGSQKEEIAGITYEKTARQLAIPPQKLKDIYENYDRNLRNAGKIDFDDMMLLCLRVFRERTDILKYWRERFGFILIDEFQDINRLQYELVKMLAYPENNVFAVGDDDQSVYGFRGATPKMMFEFEKDFRGCRRILLDINYRSYEEITAGASRLISVNKERFRKRVGSAKGPGGILESRHFENLDDEIAFICGIIREAAEKGKKLSEFAVLYRMNNQVRPLRTAFVSQNIPYRLQEKTSSVFDHWIAGDMLAYLELADVFRRTDGNGKLFRREDLIKVANRPVRYIGRDSFRNEEISMQELYAVNQNRRYVLERLEKLEKDLMFISRLDVTAALKYILYGFGYKEYLKTASAEKNLDIAELNDIAFELASSAKSMETVAEWREYMDEYRRKLAEEEQRTKREDGKGKTEAPDGVELMTFHRSKGLEFDTVFIIDASEGYTPQKKAETAEEIEEERRMFYVAATRARNTLYICDCDDRNGRAAKTSRFVSEMGLIH